MSWRGLVVGAAAVCALGCADKGKKGPPPLPKAEQARAVACADALVAASDGRDSSEAAPVAVAVAGACSDACPAFAQAAKTWTDREHVALGAACDPGCEAAKGISTTPIATYWSRLAAACGHQGYGGAKDLLTADWYVIQRALAYLARVAPRARGDARNRLDVKARAEGGFIPMLPAVVDGVYAAPPSRLGREPDLDPLVIIRGADKASVAPWPRGGDGGASFPFPVWQPGGAQNAAQLAKGAARSHLIVTESASTTLAGLGDVVAAVSADTGAAVGVAMPRGVLGAHPVRLIRPAAAAPKMVVVIDGDALYASGRKLPRGTRGHDWASLRSVLRDYTGTLSLKTGPGATSRDLVQMLDLAKLMNHRSIAVLPADAAVETGVSEVPADAVTVGFSVPKVGAGLHGDQVMTALRSARPALRACYAAELAGKPKLAGTAVARLHIDQAGKVALVTVKGVDKAVSACAAKALRGVAFPAPRGKGVVATVPISFKRKAK